MHKWLFLLLATLCLTFLGCDRSSTPGGAYRDADIAFDYPPGWSISAQDVGPGATERVVVARGPDNAVLVLIRAPTESAMPLRDFAVSFAKSRDANVEERGRIGSHSFLDTGPSNLEASRERVGGAEVDGLRQNFSLKLLGFEVPFEAHFTLISNTRRTLYIVTQNGVRHRATTQPSFAVLLGSLRLLPADAASGG